MTLKKPVYEERLAEEIMRELEKSGDAKGKEWSRRFAQKLGLSLEEVDKFLGASKN